jgi:peptide/nickel transport system substrate-binding protein
MGTGRPCPPEISQHALDLPRAEKLLDAAGFPRQPNGIRLHLALKTSTEEQARLIGTALQEQWRRAGIELELRPLEVATLFSDMAKGNFQVSYARWVGANNDPDSSSSPSPASVSRPTVPTADTTATHASTR